MRSVNNNLSRRIRCQYGFKVLKPQHRDVSCVLNVTFHWVGLSKNHAKKYIAGFWENSDWEFIMEPLSDSRKSLRNSCHALKVRCVYHVECKWSTGMYISLLRKLEDDGGGMWELMFSYIWSRGRRRRVPVDSSCTRSREPWLPENLANNNLPSLAVKLEKGRRSCWPQVLHPLVRLQFTTPSQLILQILLSTCK